MSFSDLKRKLDHPALEQFSDDDEDAMNRWITIGGHPDKSGKHQHVGGTPVEINSKGDIEKGPKELKGENVAHLPKRPIAETREPEELGHVGGMVNQPGLHKAYDIEQGLKRQRQKNAEAQKRINPYAVGAPALKPKQTPQAPQPHLEDHPLYDLKTGQPTPTGAEGAARGNDDA